MAKTPQKTKPTELGQNRTGVQTAPARTKEMLENTEAMPADPRGAHAAALERAELSSEAPPIGTMPLPANVKGAVKAAAKAVKGEHAPVFLDKLGERLAFERTGVRIYDAVLAKLPASRKTEGTLTSEALAAIRDEELAHFHLCREAMEKMGGDPTAVTPSADVMGVASTGLLQVVTDPRVTLTQALDALLTAELTDNDGWKLLISMAEALGQEDLARRFTDALAAEDRHLQMVRAWLSERLQVQLGARMPPAEFGEPTQPA
jgi:rubrerythrin